MTERCYCYGCEREVLASPLPDLELGCASCGSTCLERLAPPAPTLPAEATDAGAEATNQPSLAALGEELSTLQGLLQMQRAQRPLQRAHRHYLNMDTARRRHQGQIGSRYLPGGTGTRHVGVICDGCGAQDFSGVRYRCLRCRDYDLCSVCHSQRGVMHPSHPFEAITTPRRPGSQMSQMVANLASSPTRTVVAVVEIGLQDLGDARSGLEDPTVAWWLADDKRLVKVEDVAQDQPGWSCPICSEGLEVHDSNGWVVRICTAESEATPASNSKENVSEDNEVTSDVTSEQPLSAESEKKERLHGHIYHEACLRRWLVKRNSCPVCRRSPVVPPSTAF